MYTRILVAIEHSAADRTILDHVARLATMTGAELLLVDRKSTRLNSSH